MRHFFTREQREDSASSVESSSSKSSMSSLQTWYRKRKRNSFSPSPPPRQDSSRSEGTSVDSSRESTRSRHQGFNSSRMFHHVSSAEHPYPVQDSLVENRRPPHIQQRNTSLPAAQTQELDQIERIISNCRSVRLGRRRSSVRFPEILPPQDFTAKELRKPIELSKPICPFFVGRVYRPNPEPGLRVETKARSRESCLLTTRPLYSAHHHSPLVTGRPYTAYFEGEIRPGSDEDSVRLVLGFVAGREQATFMPGSERGSIGVNFRDGGLYVNRKLLAKAVGKPGEQVGIGMTFSKSDVRVQEVDGVQSSAVISPSICVEVFLSRDGKKAGSWNLGDLRDTGSLAFEGLEGDHDLYAAVGTLKEVNVDILFDKRGWKYHPNAG